MGEHKYNPVAIAARNGELPPKARKMSKKERKRILLKIMMDRFYNRLSDHVAEYYEEINR